ncbi:MAG: hypothetical protein AAGD92_14370 [Pseudomonadota bacterium]
MNDQIRVDYGDDVVVENTVICQPAHEETTKKSVLFPILAAVFGALAFLLIGYLLCVRAGWIVPVHAECCLILDFDFEFDGASSVHD